MIVRVREREMEADRQTERERERDALIRRFTIELRCFLKPTQKIFIP